MRAYDPELPLIGIHIPKAAGTSARFFFESWFSDGFLSHYPNEALEPGEPHDLEALHSREKLVVLYGHFSIDRGYGIERNYPNAKQFTTILRDPLELSISLYHHVRKVFKQGRRKSLGRFSGSLEDFLTNNRCHMLNHFPRPVSEFNYRDLLEEYFIEIGIAEDLETSMMNIAASLDKRYDPALLGHHNATERSSPPAQNVREIFIENHGLEYEIYNYAKAQFQNRKICSRSTPMI